MQNYQGSCSGGQRLECLVLLPVSLSLSLSVHLSSAPSFASSDWNSMSTVVNVHDTVPQWRPQHWGAAVMGAIAQVPGMQVVA